MLTLSENIGEALQSGASHFCRCWRIDLLSGTVLGFTDHDRSLRIEDIEYVANSGMNAAELESALGMSVDNGLAMGAISSDHIRDADIDAGLFDKAKVTIWKVDWRDTSIRIQIFAGTLGEITRNDRHFEVELRGLSEPLGQMVGRSFLRTCDRLLGDDKCRVDINHPDFSVATPIVEIEDRRRVLIPMHTNYPEGWFDGGTIVWPNGLQTFVKSDVSTSQARLLDLWEELRFDTADIEQITVIAGCDKRPSTCKTKFQNFVNFRGFPHIPGEDFVTRYPDGTRVYDGRSLFEGADGGDA